MKSSTEGDLIGVHDGLGVLLWSKYFIGAQGYTMEYNKLYKDNIFFVIMHKIVGL